jgi:hypothetical protein
MPTVNNSSSDVHASDVANADSIRHVIVIQVRQEDPSILINSGRRDTAQAHQALFPKSHGLPRMTTDVWVSAHSNLNRFSPCSLRVN